MKLLGLILFFSQIVLAGMTQGQIKLQIQNNEAVLTPNKGFHFNDKAPAYFQSASKVLPTTKTEQKLVFKSDTQNIEGSLTFYVCDDAKTICEKHDMKVDFKKGTSSSAKIQQANDQLAEKKQPSKDIASNGKTTLLIFSAPWCPACMRMHSEVFPKAQVKSLFKKIEVKKINIDLVENEHISNQYGIKAIPTVVLVNEKGEEMFRWLDYQPADKFARELKNEMNAQDTLSTLEKKVIAGDIESSVKLGKIYYGKMDWEKAVKYLAPSKKLSDTNLRLSAEVNLAMEAKDEDEKKTPEYQQALEKAFVLSSSVIDQVRWKLDLAESKKETIEKSFVKDIVHQLQELEKNKQLNSLFEQSTYGDPAGLSTAEILDMQARAYSVLKDEASKKVVEKKIEAYMQKAKLNYDYPGQVVAAIQYMNQIGDTKQAEMMSQKLIEKYPKTYVYYNRYASFLTKQNRHADALVQINKALEFKEGNEPQLNTSKIKILKSLKQNKEALDLLNSTLEMIKPNPEKYKRTKASLEKIKEELVKQ